MDALAAIGERTSDALCAMPATASAAVIVTAALVSLGGLAAVLGNAIAMVLR